MVCRVSNNHYTCLTCMIHRRVSRQCNKVIFRTMSVRRVLIYRPRFFLCIGITIDLARILFVIRGNKRKLYTYMRQRELAHPRIVVQ